MAESGEEPFAGTARFQLRRRLGAGAFGVVYEAYDRERSSVVALKRLRRAGEEALYRLKQEFRSLADITHPNLAALYELLSDGGQWFFTMELVDGKSFHDYVRDGSEVSVKYPEGTEQVDSVQETQTFELPSGASGQPRAAVTAQGDQPARFNVERLRSALRQAAAGIRALHTAGKLHRDIKSSNVLVTRSERVVLLDFGLVTELGLADGDQSMAMAGTPAYMSPEQGAGLPVSEASDWYSFGVMLYEALTGQSPFAGKSAEILLEKQVREPQPPRELVSGVPEDLDQLCCELLRRDPRLRPDGAEIVQRLGGQLPRSESPSARADARAPFVGRQRHLAQLLDAFRKAEQGQAVTVALHGGSGMGKSALVRRFLDTLRPSQRVVILAGRCFERESVPYKALDSLMDVLSSYLKRLPTSQAEALMPRDVLALARLFPVLRRVEAVAGARRRVLEIRDVHELRRRAFGAFRELAARLVEESPLVLFIDDLQWGDLDSAAMLEELMRPPEAPALLLIVAYRSEEASTSPLLRKLLPERLGSQYWQEIEVDRLDPLEALNLARALLADSRRESEALADAVARESSGNPFFLSELARSVRGEGEHVIASSDGDPETVITLDHVIRSRVSRLSPAERRFLEIVAVAGRPVQFAVAKDAAEPAPHENVIEALRIGRLIRTRETETREEIETYHDRIREAVVAGLSPEDLKAHHHRLALALETSGQADPEWLAMHWKGAEDLDRAAEYAATAARRASETLAFDRAARLYLLALELPDRTEPEARRALQASLGDALANAGRGAEAASSYLSAARGARRAEALELQRRAAEQLLLSGHIDQSLPVLRTVLGEVGFRYLESTLGSLLSFLFHRLLIRLRGLKFHERDATQIAPEKLIRIDTCWSLSSGLSMIDTLRGRDYQARHLLLALKAGEPYRIARAISNEAGYSATGGPPNARRTGVLVETATRLAARVGHPQAIGVAQLAVGITAYAEGRWKTAWHLAEKGEAILRERCTGVAWELDTFHIYSLRALFYLGEIAELSSRLPTLLREARERDDLFAETSLRSRHSYIAWLASDEPRKARSVTQDAVARWSKRAFYMQHYYALVAEADTALYMREPHVALRILRERHQALRHSRLMRVHHLRVEWLHLRARSEIAMAPSVDPSSCESLLSEAESHARRIERERVHWADALAALARAGIASIRGNRVEAARQLGFAASHFAFSDMALYAAVSRRRLGSIVGGEKGKALADSADAWMRNQGIQNPAGFAEMLAPGRFAEES
ncbi:MAG TPA: protein kinase [Thermoanaerobaculia bacterium]